MSDNAARKLPNNFTHDPTPVRTLKPLPAGQPAPAPVQQPKAEPKSEARPEARVESKSESKPDMRYLLKALIKYNASDLHIKAGRPPLFRINGKLVPAKMPALEIEEVQSILWSVMKERQIKELETKLQVDFSFRMKDMGGFRCNVYYQRGSLSAAVRTIPINIPHIDSLGVPSVIKDLCQRPRGLLLITGATGTGKSTTMASVLQYINETSQVHVLAIEDPIEFVYRDLKASITQREVGSDTHSIKDALYAGLRQDPDVIMIGEMRDRETIEGALTAAETGHLVISTLHTNDAKTTIDRIVDVFPHDAQAQIRVQIANSLIGVFSQQLIMRADGSGRVLACEVMIKSPMIEEYILKNELEKIPEAISKSNSYYKMQTLNMALEKLVSKGVIAEDEALKASNNPDDLRMKFSGFSREYIDPNEPRREEKTNTGITQTRDVPLDHSNDD